MVASYGMRLLGYTVKSPQPIILEIVLGHLYLEIFIRDCWRCSNYIGLGMVVSSVSIKNLLEYFDLGQDLFGATRLNPNPY